MVESRNFRADKAPGTGEKELLQMRKQIWRTIRRFGWDGGIDIPHDVPEVRNRAKLVLKLWWKGWSLGAGLGMERDGMGRGGIERGRMGWDGMERGGMARDCPGWDRAGQGGRGWDGV